MLWMWIFREWNIFICGGKFCFVLFCFVLFCFILFCFVGDPAHSSDIVSIMDVSNLKGEHWCCLLDNITWKRQVLVFSCVTCILLFICNHFCNMSCRCTDICNVFCYICGHFALKSQNKTQTPLMKKAYKLTIFWIKYRWPEKSTMILISIDQSVLWILESGLILRDMLCRFQYPWSGGNQKTIFLTVSFVWLLFPETSKTKAASNTQIF
jgi:hypothetical protein